MHPREARNRHRRSPHAVVLLTSLLAAITLAGCAPQQPVHGRPDCLRAGGGHARAKNIILLVSDGAGFNCFDATSYYQHGELGRQVYDGWPVRLACTTYMLGRDGEPGGYDPAAFWSDFDRSLHGSHATDSAAAATALYTGRKTYGGAIAVDIDRRGLTTIAERADHNGMRAGAVTSVQFSHATPAALAAHNHSRGNYAAIAHEMIYGRTLDVVMGCGHPEYDHDGRSVDEADHGYKYVGGRAAWEDLKAGTTGKGWTLIDSKADFEAIAVDPSQAPDRLFGVARCRKTLQEGREGDGMGEPNTNVPDLPTMTMAAIHTLSRDGDGFFLMVEGGAVDWANHHVRLGRMVEEQVDFNRAVEAVAGWVERHSSWDETLVIVTSDHECGGLWGPEADGEEPFQRVVNRGKGKLPGAKHFYGSHTNALVPLYARGPGAGRFVGLVRGIDPVWGAYVDNTDIYRVMAAALGGGRAGCAGRRAHCGRAESAE